MLSIRKTALCLAALASFGIQASSHREAPFITENPKVDGTDFYMFRSYEAGRAGFVTFLANFQPLQNPYGGPNYFVLDPQALYEIHIDNNGDANEDLTFQFRFNNTSRGIALDVGPAGNTIPVAIPLAQAGPIGPAANDNDALNVVETYRVNIIRGDRRTGTLQSVINSRTGNTMFSKPVDNIGNKTIPNYPAYARQHISDITIPGCSRPGRVFVGQRREGFDVNLGEVFDLINLDPLGAPDGRGNTIGNANITTLALEVNVACLIAPGQTVIGGWSTASLPARRNLLATGGARESGDFVQVSRLGMPLVNELVIGLEDKDRFNGSEPSGDGQFINYVTNPTLPELIEILFGPALGLTEVAPNNFPRNDLVTAFLTGIPGLNQPVGVVGSEMLRLNTAVLPRVAAAQSNLGLLGGDDSGFPNGRRPGDDTVDITLRVAMGAICHAFPGTFCNPADAPIGTAALTDGASVSALEFDSVFPYLVAPIPGSPNEAFAAGISP